MEAFQERLVAERDELAVRLNRLQAFMLMSVYDELPPVEKFLLNIQENLMSAYLKVLCERIEVICERLSNDRSA